MFATQQPVAALPAGAPQQAPDSAKFSASTEWLPATSTRGFVISTPPSSCFTPAAAGWHSSAGSSSGCSGSSTPAPDDDGANKRQAAAGEASTPVGWSGLLEISRSGGGPGLVGGVPPSSEQDGGQGHIEVACTAHASTGVRRLVKSVIRGLKARQEPEAAREGMGGTYFFPNEAGRKVAIFKPCDEEPLAAANPKGYVGRALGDPGWKATVRVGEAAMREVAAYLLDYDHFAQVPHTVLVQARHPVFNYAHAGNSSGGGVGMGAASSGSVCSMASVTTSGGAAAACERGAMYMKLGSLQEFVYHIADTSEFGASRFRMRDVHAIGILDLRLFNTDRHAGNILVRQPGRSASSRDLAAWGSSRTLGSRPPSMLDAAAAAAVVSGGSYELIPIDHGFCLPEALDAPYFEWLHWPQACLPFDEEELAYIAHLDVAADIALLQRELPNLRPECLRVLEVSTTLLQCCAAAGLSLADIGALASRPLDALDGDDSCPSELEKACIVARQAVETRELSVQLASSSSCSSSGGGATFTLREEDEDELLDSSELSEASEDDMQLPLSQGRSLLQQHMAQQAAAAAAAAARPRSPSRLSAVAGGVFGGGGEQAAQAGAPAAQQQLPDKAGSGDLGSVMSEATACGLATAMSLSSSRAPGAAEGCDLLFDLDDECASSGASSAATTPVGGASSNRGAPRAGSPLGRALPPQQQPQQPQQPQPDGACGGPAAAPGADVVMSAASMGDAGELRRYVAALQLLQPAGSAESLDLDRTASSEARSSSGGGGDAAAGSSGSGSLSAGGSAAMPATPIGSGGGADPVAMARTVQVGGEGWGLFRDLRAKAGLANGLGLGQRCGGPKKACGVAAAAARRRTCVQRTMYPPPVVRAAPKAANEVLHGLSEPQWAAFMDELRAYMDAALRPGSGAWRRASAAAGFGAAAMSCPRF